ncbi:DUF4160 domain-containing protein [Brevundimonas sp. AJA228-03]|nr:DUF4160 domain-containing protein [Brevundimonas sp. AJA228-03]QTN21005.1 DUF4160 domain-containing protein [Brevundimonas sp. AJA228-03]
MNSSVGRLNLRPRGQILEPCAVISQALHEPGEPSHVHVASGRQTAKVWLQPVALARSTGFPAHDLGAIIRLVRDHREAFLEAWHDHFSAN